MKDNQPTLLTTAQHLLAPLLTHDPAHTTTQVQGNRIEIHQIWCLPVSREQVAFPFVQQIFAVRRIVQPTDRTQKASDEIAYGITSVPTLADAKDTARRDKSFREDTCQVRNHNAARVRVAFRQMAIFLCEMNAHRIRIKKDVRCLPELFRFCSFNGVSMALRWFKQRRAFRA